MMTAAPASHRIDSRLVEDHATTGERDDNAGDDDDDDADHHDVEVTEACVAVAVCSHGKSNGNTT